METAAQDRAGCRKVIHRHKSSLSVCACKTRKNVSIEIAALNFYTIFFLLSICGYIADTAHRLYGHTQRDMQRFHEVFFTRDSCTGRYCWERVLAMAIRSVRLSVTTLYGFKPRWDRDSGFSPYDSLESLVSSEVIWCRWVRTFPLNEGIK